MKISVTNVRNSWKFLFFVSLGTKDNRPIHESRRAGPRVGFARGFESYAHVPGATAQQVTTQALPWLAEHAGGAATVPAPPVLAGSPAQAPIAPFLVPAGALGIADWLNRRGDARLEARWGATLLGIQVAATAIISVAPFLLSAFASE